MEQINILAVTRNSPEYEQVWQLREEVLRKPLGMSLKNEDLSMDAVDNIFIATEKDRVIGCLMLHDIDGSIIKFRQMAVYGEWQSKGIGKLLIQAAEKHAAAKGYTTVKLHARMVAEGFYRRLGYTPEGAQFTEVGIPHVLMQKNLDN